MPDIASPNEAIAPMYEIFVHPNARRVRELRDKRGWTQERLKGRVGCSKKTIENIEAGRKRVRRDTLEDVAEALGVEVEQIIDRSPRPGAGPAPDNAAIELVLDLPFDSFPEEERDRFLQEVKALLSLTGDLRVISRRPGSGALTLGLSEEDCGRLFGGVVQGRLLDHHVIQARRVVASEADRDGWTYHSGPHPLPAPLQVSACRAEGPRTAPSVLPAGGTPQCSLLVVDDEAHIRSTLRLLLEKHFTVLEAESADAAEEVFRKSPVDLILTDQKMPGRTGVQLLEWALEHHPRTIRLLMTGGPELEATIEAINRGQVYHYISKPYHHEELLHILRNGAEKFALERDRDQLLEELQEANARLLQRTRELERAAQTDPLTGLYNRRAIEEQARFELRRHNRYPSPLSLGRIGVDQSDLLGSEDFQAGSDEVLEELAHVLASALREVDSIGRLHGQDFLVVARETGATGAARLAERIRATVASTRFEYDGQVIPITLSIGFAIAEAGTHANLDAITAVAVAALDQARSAGGNRCEAQRLPAPRAEQG